MKKKRRKKQCFNWNNKKHYILMMVVCLKLSNNWLTCFDSIQSLKYCRVLFVVSLLWWTYFFLFFLLETIKRSFLSFRIHSFCLFVVGLNGLTNIEKKVGACFFLFISVWTRCFFPLVSIDIIQFSSYSSFAPKIVHFLFFSLFCCCCCST